MKRLLCFLANVNCCPEKSYDTFMNIICAHKLPLGQTLQKVLCCVCKNKCSNEEGTERFIHTIFADDSPSNYHRQKFIICKWVYVFIAKAKCCPEKGNEMFKHTIYADELPSNHPLQKGSVEILRNKLLPSEPEVLDPTLRAGRCSPMICSTRKLFTPLAHARRSAAPCPEISKLSETQITSVPAPHGDEIRDALASEGIFK